MTTKPAPEPPVIEQLMVLIRQAAAPHAKFRLGPLQNRRPTKAALIAKSAATPKVRKTQPTFLVSEDADRVHAFHNELAASASIGAYHGTLNLQLDRAIELRILKHAGYQNPTDCWHRIMRRHLKGLGTRYYTYLAYASVENVTEQATRTACGLPPKKRFHAHGEFGCKVSDLAVVKKALIKAGGATKDEYGRPTSARLEVRSCPSGYWRSFAAKTGERYSVTEDLQMPARERYEVWREADKMKRAEKAAFDKTTRATKKAGRTRSADVK